MRLNPNKSKIMIVNRLRTVNSPHGSLIIGDQTISESLDGDILGVKLNPRLTSGICLYFGVTCFEYAGNAKVCS